MSSEPPKTREELCDEYMASDQYAVTYDPNSHGYKICCVELDYCSFYKQNWFWYNCGGFMLFVIIVTIVLCYFRNRKVGRRSDDESPKTSKWTRPKWARKHKLPN